MISVAIDGTSGAGKSSVADEVCKRLNFLHLNTGELYRAIAYKAKKCNIDYNDENELSKMITKTKIDIKFIDGKQIVYLDGENISNKLHNPEMSRGASLVSQFKNIRESIKELQRSFAKQFDIVIEGRDIGTEILPNATHKIFLTASPEARAERRVKQLIEDGQDNINYNEILDSIKKRDYTDSHRQISPLKQAEDAIYIDSSNLTFDEVVNKILDIIKG